VLVNGVLVVDDFTFTTGYGPVSVTFLADTGDTITTVWTSGSYDSECTYCIYDGTDAELGCDGPSPTGITVTGLCPTCEHSLTGWDSYGDGWNGGMVDVLVNGVIVVDDFTLAGGSGPESVTFTAATGDAITTVWTPGSYDSEVTYCIYDGFGGELGCDGTYPTGIAVTGNCSAAVCGDGACTGDEDCCNCPVDCGAYGCLNQPQNGTNGIFSDLDCGACSTGIQLLADQFMICDGVEIQLDQIRFWGGYWPDNNVTDPDLFTVIFRDNNAGVPGGALLTLGPVAATTKTATGVVLFGVDEYVYTIDFDDLFIPAGIYFIEIYNDTTGSTDQWFWEVGDLDSCAGVAGSAYSFTVPEEPWNYDAATDMSLELICVTKANPPSDKPVPVDVSPTAPVSVTAQGVAGD
jgi:hypothetical protein